MIPMQVLGAGFWKTQVYNTDKHRSCIRKAMFVWDGSPQPISSAEFPQFPSSGLDTSLGCLSILGSLLPWNAKFSSPFTPHHWPSRTGQTEPRDPKPSLCKKSKSSHYIFLDYLDQWVWVIRWTPKVLRTLHWAVFPCGTQEVKQSLTSPREKNTKLPTVYFPRC